MTILRTGAGPVKYLGTIVVAVVLSQMAGELVAGFETEAPAPSSISLSPAVVMLQGASGQAHRQTLQLTNHTSRALTFTLEAQDVVVLDGQRRFFPAGDRPGSIAATAVFAPKEIVIAAGSVGRVELTLTVPVETAVRGVAAVFRGVTPMGTRDGVVMTSSLGCLITFNLSGDVRLEATRPLAIEQSRAANLSLTQWVTNVGSEPVVPKGAIAVVNASGTLVGKLAVDPQRLLPGETLKFGGDYPALLPAGSYRAVVSLQYGDKVHTSAVDFSVPAAAGDRRRADRQQ